MLYLLQVSALFNDHIFLLVFIHILLPLGLEICLIDLFYSTPWLGLANGEKLHKHILLFEYFYDRTMGENLKKPT